MYKIIIFFCTVLLVISKETNAQEIKAKVSVNSAKVGSGVDKKIFNTLQTSIINFINNRKWTDKAVAVNEKIECNFNIVITEVPEPNTYKATLSIQAARPVFNSTYKSPLVNFSDDKLIFKYVEFQAIDFNENRIQGNDALVANLSATLAYYINIILGMDFDSFGLKTGDVYFQKAQNIVNNAPANSIIEGWKAFDGQRNRYWLSENFNSSRYVAIHDVIYNYYRKAMDYMYENEQQARQEMINCLVLLSNLTKENSGTTNMFSSFFMQSRSQEFINFFKKANGSEKSQALEILKVVDVINANKYKDELK
jgi:Domain of unknown function (DUF4835)